ncbi:MAG: phosphoglycerate dehydrogenase [Clostridiaceae bacterium]|jgi:D-3-phosphoglycerate dehydrogenase|nr:phosphoglycerate dehydrogenase [Clostridiaceae bacterium]
MCKKILINTRRENGDPLYDYLKNGVEGLGYELIRVKFTKEESSRVVEAAQGCEIVIPGGELWNRENLAGVKESTRFIALMGVGYDNVDVKSATEYGIAVANTPGSNSNAVAEGCLAIMLSLCRKIAFMDRSMRNGIWISGMLTTEIIGKTVGIVGFGHIGKRLAELLTGFHCNILVYDVVKDPAWEGKVKFVDLDYLIPESDIISLHLPCNDHTRGMVDKNFLRKMKKTAFLINTSRGGIVNELDLIEALESGTIAGAGLDVFEREPISPYNPLLSMDQVVLTPHFQAASKESAFNSFRMLLENIKDFSEGKIPKSILNPDFVHYRSV